MGGGVGGFGVFGDGLGGRVAGLGGIGGGFGGRFGGFGRLGGFGGLLDLVGLEDLVCYCVVVQEYQGIELVDLVDKVCSVLLDDLQELLLHWFPKEYSLWKLRVWGGFCFCLY